MTPRGGPWRGCRRTCGFASKPEIALEQIRRAVADGVPHGVVVTDAGYGNDAGFREGVTASGLAYVAGIQRDDLVGARHRTAAGQALVWPRPTTKAAAPGRRTWTARGREAGHGAARDRVAEYHLAGTAGKLNSRFAAIRVRPAHRDTDRAEPRTEEWLLVEWPVSEKEPSKYWLSTLPGGPIEGLVATAKLRWRIERDFEELKQELGLGHFEGRGWRGFHHHASLCIAAYGFLVAERCRFSPPGWRPRLRMPELSDRPRGSPRSSRAAQSRLHRHLAPSPRPRAHAPPSAMSLLPARLPATTQAASFMTR